MVVFYLNLGRDSFECDSCDSSDVFVNRCVICCQFFCEVCITVYKRGRGIKIYYLKFFEEVKEEGFIVVVRLFFCNEYEGEMYKLFCETCDEVVCRDCIIIKYRDYKCIFIKEYFVKEKDIIIKFLLEIKIKVFIFKNVVRGICEMKRNLQIYVEQIVQSIINFFYDLLVSFNIRFEELINEVEEMKKAKLIFLDVQ